MVERRACPCTKIEILLKSRRDRMLVPVPVSVVPVPKVHWYSTALGYRYHYIWYRYHCFTACGYQKCTGTPQPWGIGTTIFGTGTIASLHVGTGTNKCCTGITTSATAPLHCSTTLGLSIAAIIDNDDLPLFSGIEPLRKCARDSKNLHTYKNARKGQKHLFYTKREQNMSWGD